MPRVLGMSSRRGALRVKQRQDALAALGIGEERIEALADAPPAGLEVAVEGGERVTCLVAQRAGEPRARRVVLRNAVGLALLLHLDAVLRASQEPVGLEQRVRVLARQHAGLRQRLQRALGGAAAQLRDASAVQQLVRLRDELDVADAARADLQVEVAAGAARLLLDPLLHVLDASHARNVHRRGVEDGVERADDAPAELEVAGHGPRLHEGGLLPGRRPRLVVGLERDARHHQRAAAALGPQVEVDAVQEAASVGLGDAASEVASEAGEVLLGRQVRGAVGQVPGRLGRTLEHVDEIDVGREVELLGAELPQSQGAEAQAQRLAVLARPLGWSRALRELRLRLRQCARQQAVRQVGDLAEHLADARERHELLVAVAAHDAGQLAVLEAPQRVGLAVGVDVAQGGVEPGLVVLERAGLLEIVLDQGQELVRVAKQPARQEGGDAAHDGERPNQGAGIDLPGADHAPLVDVGRRAEDVGRALECGFGLGRVRARGRQGVGEPGGLEPVLQRDEGRGLGSHGSRSLRPRPPNRKVWPFSGQGCRSPWAIARVMGGPGT